MYNDYTLSHVCVYFAGHDGLIALWDILSGTLIKRFQLEVQNMMCMYMYVYNEHV